MAILVNLMLAAFVLVGTFLMGTVAYRMLKQELNNNKKEE